MNPETLHAYFDDELPPDERARVEAALRADASLAEELRLLGEVDRALETLAAVEASPGFEARIRARRAREEGRRRLLRLLAPFAAAAAIVAALFLARGGGAAPAPDPFAEPLLYMWETDTSTYGSLGLDALEAEVLRELERS
jgi:anti-sigma factor RsiW